MKTKVSKIDETKAPDDVICMKGTKSYRDAMATLVIKPKNEVQPSFEIKEAVKCNINPSDISSGVTAVKSISGEEVIIS